METRASVVQKWAGRVLLAAGASAVLAVLLRDRNRRLQGIPRRSPRDILVQIMVTLRINNLAQLFSRSKVASYGLLLLLSLGGVVYGQSLWRGLRSLVLGRQLAPADALEDYPRDESDDDAVDEEDDPDTEAEMSAAGVVLLQRSRRTGGESGRVSGASRPGAARSRGAVTRGISASSGNNDDDGIESPTGQATDGFSTQDEYDSGTATGGAKYDPKVPVSDASGAGVDGGGETLRVSSRSRSKPWESRPGRVGRHHRSGGRSSSGGTDGRPLRARHGRGMSVARGLAEADAVARERRRADRREALAVAKAAVDRHVRAEHSTQDSSSSAAVAKVPQLGRSRSQDYHAIAVGPKDSESPVVTSISVPMSAAARVRMTDAGISSPFHSTSSVRALPSAAKTETDGTPTVALPEGAGSISALAGLGPSGVAFLRELQATAAGLDVEVMLALHDKLETITLEPGEVLFRRGGAADEGLYVVVRGALEVVDEAAAGAAAALARRGRGSAQPPVGAVPLPAAVTGTRAGTDERTARAAVAFAWQLPGGSGRSSIAAAIAAPGIETHRRMVLRDALPHALNQDAATDRADWTASHGSASHRHTLVRGATGRTVTVTPAPRDSRPSVADVWLRRRRLADAARREGVLATFRRAQTVGENALLAGPGETRAATVRATPAKGRNGQPQQTTVLRMSRKTFSWVVDAFPHAAASFVLSTTARQWRVAHLALVDFLRVPEAVALDREPRIRPEKERTASEVADWLRRADGAAWALMLCAGQGLDDTGLASRARHIYDRLQAGVSWEVAAGLTAPGSRNRGGEDQWRAGADDTAWDGEADEFSEDEEEEQEEEVERVDTDSSTDDQADHTQPSTAADQASRGAMHRAQSFEERRMKQAAGQASGLDKSATKSQSSLAGSATWLSGVLGAATTAPDTAVEQSSESTEARRGPHGTQAMPGITPMSRAAKRRRWRKECSASLEAIAFRLQGSQRAGLPGRGASFVRLPSFSAASAGSSSVTRAVSTGQWTRSQAILPALAEADSQSETSTPPTPLGSTTADAAPPTKTVHVHGEDEAVTADGSKDPKAVQSESDADSTDPMDEDQRGFRERVQMLEAASAGIVTLKPGDVLYREGADGNSPSDEPAAAALLRAQGGPNASQTCFRSGACYVLLSGRAAAVTALPANDMDISIHATASPTASPVHGSQRSRHTSRTRSSPSKATAVGASSVSSQSGDGHHDLRIGTGRSGLSRAQKHRRWSSGDYSQVLPSCGQATPGEFLPSTHRIVRQLLPGDIAGGIACVCEVPHRETIVALAACTVAVFPRSLLEAAAKPPAAAWSDQPHSGRDGTSREKSQAHEPTELSDESRGVIVSLLLRCSKLLRPLLHLFLGMGLKRSWRHAGEVLFREGEACESGMFLVVSGRVRVFREQQTGMDAGADGEDVSAGGHGELGQATMEVSRGATVGELAVLAGSAKRDSSALCVRDTEFVTISRASLSRILATHPGVMGRFSRALAERQLAMQRRLAGGDGVLVSGGMPFHLHSSLKAPGGNASATARGVGGALNVAGMDGTGRGCVAVLPAGRGGRPLRQVGAWLSAELTCLCGVPARCICAEDVDAALGEGTTARMTRVLERARVGAWLSRQEEVHSYTVLIGDTAPTSWSRLVAQQADVILLIGRGEDSEEAATEAAQLNDVEAHAVFGVRGAGTGAAHGQPRMMAQPSVAERLEQAGEAVGQALEALAGAAETLSKAAQRALRGTHTAAGHTCTGLENDAPRNGVVLEADTIRPGARASRMRTLARVELVLLWPEGTALPTQTRKWLRPRLLAAHHHVQEADAPWLHAEARSEAGGTGSTATGSGAVRSITSDSASGASVSTEAVGGLADTMDTEDSEADSSTLMMDMAAGDDRMLETLAEVPTIAATRRTTVRASSRGGARGTAAGDNGIARIARFLTGQAVGVVMGGGGARGLAHLGVLRALRERGVPVDFIAGTSQGAFMAATWATNLDVVHATQAASGLSAAVGSVWVLMSGLTLPLISYFDGTSFSEAIQDALGPATQVEDMWLQYYCVSTNVTAARMDIHQTGPLWRCCRASMTVLGLLPPILDHSRQHLLADGGYLDNLPVGVMSALAPPAGFRAIIAIDVENKESGRPLENVEDYGQGLSGWWLLGRWALATLGVGPPVRIPAMSHVSLNLSYISHSIRIRHLLASASRLAGRHGPVGNGESASVVALSEGTGALGACGALLYVRPDVGHYGLLDYDKMGEIAARGRLETDAVLSEWLTAVNQPVCRFVSSMPRPEPSGAATHLPLQPATRSEIWARDPLADAIPAVSPVPSRSVSPAHLDLAEPTHLVDADAATPFQGLRSESEASTPLYRGLSRPGHRGTSKSSQVLSRVGLSLSLSEGPGSHVWQAAKEASSPQPAQDDSTAQQPRAGFWHRP